MAPAIINRDLLGNTSRFTSLKEEVAAAKISCSKQLNGNLNAFDQLVEDIRSILGEHRDLKSEDVDADELRRVLGEYVSEQREWEKYSFVDLSRHYTRNLVDDINANANLVIMTWTPGKSSLVHDHTNSHCIMRVLRGQLVETKYHWPEPGSEAPLQVKEVKRFGEGEVAYINDDLGIHKVENGDPEQVTVSLHLYTPPYIEEKGCNTFNIKTGKAQHISMAAYYSANGRKLCGKKRSGADACAPAA